MEPMTEGVVMVEAGICGTGGIGPPLLEGACCCCCC